MTNLQAKVIERFSAYIDRKVSKAFKEELLIDLGDSFKDSLEANPEVRMKAAVNRAKLKVLGQ